MDGDNVSKVEINVHDGGQINFVKDNGSINAIQNNTNEDVVYQPKIKSRTQEYANKWNQNMFLNDFDKRDENAGVNVKLRDVYLEKHLPHYIWGSSQKSRSDLKELLSEYIIDKKETKMLLIFGQPGIGKSTLITWIVANFVESINNILVYKFASDLKGVDWQENRITDRILEELDLSYDELEGKTLIIDGFDEVNVGDYREKILASLYADLIYDNKIKNFSLIITCRLNYVRFEKILCKYIVLQTWNEKQIESFCTVYHEKTKSNITQNTIDNVIKNHEILAIPLILYMVIALNISIEKNGSIVDVYDKIFSLEGGIYDRCIDNKYFAKKHRIAEIKEQIHQISREIAIWMFENNSEEASIPKREFQEICNNIIQKQQKNKAIEQDILIGNYFKVKHCEGIETEELYFIHRSIYEYFVAETIYNSISKSVNESEKTLACAFGRLLKRNRLSKEMLTFLEKKIKKSMLYKIFDKINASFQLMLQDGMTYNTNECYKNVIDCEMCVFANMLEIIHLWEIGNHLLQFDSSIKKYINYNSIYDLNLSNLNLEIANLSEAKLDGVNLCGAKLCGAKLNTLSKVKINGSIWSKNDILHIRTLSKAKFMFIIIEEEQKIIFRSEIFPYEY